jgi:limonene-1,2-epoxide hydrolase
MTASRLVRVFAACALLLLPAAWARADTDAQKLAVAHEMFQAWHDLDWKKVVDLFAEDGVLHSMMGEPIVGRQAVGERIMALGGGTERITLEALHLGIIDGLVFVERVDDFVYKGKHGRVPVVGVLQIEGGKVKEWREYYDRAMLLREMGVEPAPARQ